MSKIGREALSTPYPMAMNQAFWMDGWMDVCYLLRPSGWMDALQATLVQFFSYVGNISPQGIAKELEDIRPRTIMAID